MKFVPLGPLLKENSVFPCQQQDCHGLPRLTRASDLCWNVTVSAIKHTSVLNWNHIKSLHLKQSKNFHKYQWPYRWTTCENTRFSIYLKTFCFDSFIIRVHCNNHTLAWKVTLQPVKVAPSTFGRGFTQTWWNAPLLCSVTALLSQTASKISRRLGSFTDTLRTNLAYLYLHSEGD